jgi:dinuclear metal center YbgI/SA1388 family protein
MARTSKTVHAAKPPTVAQVCGVLDRAFPRHLAEDWDNVGLLLGDERAAVRSVMVALDPSDAVIDEAIAARAALLVTHHPCWLKTPGRLAWSGRGGETSSKVARCIANGLALYAAHTNFDIAKGGGNDFIADAIIAATTTSARVAGRIAGPVSITAREAMRKIATFVPASHVDAVRAAMCDAGAGHIGEYADCSFRWEGTGSFRGSDASNPTVGAAGKYQEVGEVRLEVICGAPLVKAVIAAMRRAHPYEEAAHDIYVLDNVGAVDGLGRVMKWDGKLKGEAFVRALQTVFPGAHLRIAGKLPKEITSAGIITGSAARHWRDARSAGADVYVTSDIKHHDALDVLEAGYCMIDATHAATEHAVLPALIRPVTELYKTRIKVAFSKVDPLPWEER